MSLVAYDNSSDDSEEDSKILKKQKESVKIRIPSLKEFEDDEKEEPVSKKPKFQSGSGLFSLLPPPKNTPSINKPGFVPHILSSKKEKSSVVPTQSKNVNSTLPITSSISASTISSSSASTSSNLASSNTPEDQDSDEESICVKDDDSDAVPSNDFFWLDELASKNTVKKEDPKNNSAAFLTNTINQDFTYKLLSTSNKSLPVKPDLYNPQHVNINESKVDSYSQQYQQLSGTDTHKTEEKLAEFSHQEQFQPLEDDSGNEYVNDPKTLLKDKEFLKIQGRRREFEDINFIDVNADDQLTDKNEWLMKSITEEMAHRPKNKHNMPTQQQKRKHQITYLAFQAKEREMDLKNQWALNSSTRRETQAKYGF